MELIVVIALTAIVAGMVSVFVLRPVQGYTDLSRRVALVDSAESSLRRMTRDIRLALPNSVRVTNVGGGFAMELLPIIDGGRYATAEMVATVLDPCQNLTGFEPDPADGQFDILGTFPTLAAGTHATHRLVINNQGTGTTHDVYADAVAGADPRVITAAGITITPGTCGNAKHNVTFTAHQFRSDSPRDRVFVVTTPVSYLCEPSAAGGTLTRYSGYAIQAAQPTTAAALSGLGATGARVADHLTGCAATSTTDHVRDRGLVTLSLALADQGEQVTLTHQVQVDNSR